MLQLISDIVGFLTMGFQFLVNTIDSFIRAIVLLTTSLSFPQLLVQYMPSIIGSSILITLFVYVIKFLIGR